MKKLLSIIAVGMVSVMLPLSAKAYSVVPSCEKSCPTEEGKCTQTCEVRIENNTSTITSFSASLVFTGDADKITVTSITPGDGWSDLSTTSSTGINFSLISSTGVSTSSFSLVTFTLELEDSSVNCDMTLTPEGGSTITIETTTETEVVSTGASLPIIIIGCGAVVAVVIYLTTKKNKKLYKI